MILLLESVKNEIIENNSIVDNNQHVPIYGINIRLIFTVIA